MSSQDRTTTSRRSGSTHGQAASVEDVAEDDDEDSDSDLDESDYMKTLKGIGDYVVLFHGDLGTGERIAEALKRRAIEKTPWNRYQFVLFVFGLFHLKMACADAIWRVFIMPLLARKDATSIMGHLHIIRPKETGTIAKDPGFRRMHEVIMHDGRCRRLHCWLVEIAIWYGANTLEEWAESEPSLNEIKEISRYLALEYVATSDRLEELRSLGEDRDKQLENGLLISRYYLLYEELTHAMNSGDIGCVEATFAFWVPIFKAVGKHKYAAEMIRHITYVHNFYPDTLK